MKEVLLVSHVSGFIPQFEMNNVHLLQSMGYEVHYASNFKNPSYGDDNIRLKDTGIICHQIDFVRSPYSIENFRAYSQLKKLMTMYDFSLVHCHNPMSAALTRLAARATQTAPVIYTAHGFHFYKGAPLHMWLIYGTMEWLLSFLTCQQICINKEDYQLAKRYFHCKKVAYVPGVGIDPLKIGSQSGTNILSAKVAARFDNHGRRNPANMTTSSVKRQQLGIPDNSFVIVTAGELIHRKNQVLLLRVMKELRKYKDSNERTPILLICGHGELKQNLEKIVKDLGIQDIVRFLGYRDDLYDIYRASDLFVFPSFQEGLPAALMEAMACGLPVVCSDIRGNSELVVEDKGGFRIKTSDTAGFASGIRLIMKNSDAADSMGWYNQNRIEKYSQRYIIPKMSKIYEYWLSFNKA